MDFLRRQLRYRNYRFGLFAAIATWIYLLLVLAALVLLWYYQLFPDPQPDATFEAVPAILLTSPLSLALLMALDPIDFGPAVATLVLVFSGLVQASVLYVVLRGRRRTAPRATAVERAPGGT